MDISSDDQVNKSSTLLAEEKASHEPKEEDKEETKEENKEENKIDSNKMDTNNDQAIESKQELENIKLATQVVHNKRKLIDHPANNVKNKKISCY